MRRVLARLPAVPSAALAAALALLPPAAAHAQPTLTGSVAFVSPYVFRGALFSNGYVVQPTVELGYRGAFVGGFASVDPDGGTRGTTLAANEADLYAGYGTTAGPLTLRAVYTYYTFPIPDGDEIELTPTQEVALTARLAAAPFAPGLFVAYDFDGDTDDGDLKGLYAELSASQPFSLGGQTLSLGLAAAADAGYLLDDGDIGLAHVTASVSTDVPAGSVTLSPLLALQVSTDPVYRRSVARPTVVYGGLVVKF